MSKLRGIILMALLSCFVTAIWGCDFQKPSPAKAQVVRKKIIIQKKPTDLARQSVVTAGKKSTVTKPVTDSKPSPVVKKVSTAELRPKSDIAVTPANRKSPKLVAKKTFKPVDKPTGDLSPQSKIVTDKSGKTISTPSTNKTPAAERVKEPLVKKVQQQAAAVKVTTPTKPPAETVSSSAAVIQPATVPLPPKPQAKHPAATAKAAAAGATSKDKLAATLGNKNGKVPANYNPKGRIDPFEPLFKDEPEVVPVMAKKKKRIPRTPLERIDLGQLKLVGIIMASSGNRALVQEASGKGYIIKEGTYIGLHSGKVTAIKKDRVVIEEETDEFVGKQRMRNKELVLPKPPGE